jgi:serine/threonine-protein kinase
MTEPGVQTRLVGRYKLFEKLASGGMATIHLGAATGAVGFTRAVVIKRLHREYASDAEFVAMFVDEARLASRIRHPNVIPMLDVVSEAGELFLVMEYVHGEALGRLIAKHAINDRPIDAKLISAVGIGMLEGLHAAHEAKTEKGEPLGIVHRDVSPQNVLVGVDGATRVFDFGIAKAESRLYQTDAGNLKGKMAYMAPEQIKGDPVDRRADIWAAGVVLWEAITRRRLFVGDGSTEYTRKILTDPIPPPSNFADVPLAFDRAILKALERDREDRFATARDFAVALEEAVEPANARTVGQWVEEIAAEMLAHRADLIKTVEGSETDPNSIRRQIAVLELENAPTQVTPTGPPPPSALRGPRPYENEIATETSGALVVAKGAPTPSMPPPPPTSMPPSAQGRTGRAVPIVALLVGLGIGGALVWTRVKPTPKPADGATGQPTASAPTPVASSVAATTSAPGTTSTAPTPPATTSAPTTRTMGTGPRHKVPGSAKPRESVAPPTTTGPAPTGAGLDLDNRK